MDIYAWAIIWTLAAATVSYVQTNKLFFGGKNVPTIKLFSKKKGFKGFFKAELPQVCNFFHTQFPSLGIFINKKVGNWKN